MNINLNLLLLMAFALVALVNIYCQDDHRFIEKPGLRLLRISSKLFLMPLLVCIYLTYTVEIQPLPIIALVFAWIGDIALESHFRLHKGLKITTSSIKGLIPIGLGMTAFLCCHITYLIIFTKQIPWLTTANAPYLILFVAYITYAMLMYGYIKKHGYLKNDHHSGPNKSIRVTLLIGISIYMCAISMMSFASFLRLLTLGVGPGIFTFVGSLAFMSSDTVLSLRLLGENETMPEKYVMGSYILAQFMIVLSFIL